MGGTVYRKAADLLQVQAEISAEIADKLHRRITADERDRLTKRETTNPRAYDLVLKGSFYFDKGGTQNRKIAIEHYERAIAIDPGYALAYVSLAYHYLVFLSVANPAEFMPKVEAAVRKALELDDSLAEAHNALGQVKRSAWDLQGAERAFKRAISLNENLAEAHDGYATFLSVMGRHAEAVDESTRAKELDPLSLGFATRLGLTLPLSLSSTASSTMFWLKRAIQAVPSACLRCPPVGSGALQGIEHADVVEAEEAALEHVLAEAVLAVDPPGEVQHQLVERRFEEFEVHFAAEGLLGAVEEERGGRTRGPAGSRR